MSKASTVTFGEFSGAFGSYARNWYYDLTAFGMPKEQAHKVACDAMSDLGNAMRSGNADVSAKISKAKKDGTSEFKFGGKSDRAYQTASMAIIRVAQTLASLKAEKLIVNCDVLQHMEYTSSIASYAANSIAPNTEKVNSEELAKA
jgi:hypothetical protein